MFKSKARLLFGGACLSFVVAAQAALITTSPGGGTTVNFSQFNACTTFGSSAPAGCRTGTDVGALVGQTIIFTASETGTFNQFGQLYNGPWNLAGNGTWSSARDGYVGLNNQSGDTNDFVMFAFATPVSAVGAFMNYAPGQNFSTPIIEVLGAGMSVLESYNLSAASISTPAALNDGAFRGISRASADIVAFRVRGGFVPVLDDLTFVSSTSSVPEPGTLALLGLGLAGLAASRRRRQ